MNIERFQNNDFLENKLNFRFILKLEEILR